MLIIDDFLRAGGTLRGLSELLAEFSVTEVGTVVLMDAIKPQQKLISSYLSIVEVGQVEGVPVIRPGTIVK